MKDLITQIVIIGGGASGLSAAAAAVEAGADVIVLEANAAVGGNGLFPRGIFGVDSPLQRRKLIFAEADEIFRSCMEYSHWKIDARLIRTLIEESGDTICWLEEKGVHFTDVVHHLPNQCPEVFHITGESENTGKAVINALRAYCQQKAVQLLTDIRGKKLLLDRNGMVNGVLCENKDGEVVSVSAQKVILCTGGFTGNPELVAKFYPGLNINAVTAGGGMRHPGSGISMAMEAGADIEGHFTMEIAAPKINGYEALNLLLGKPYNVWLNKFGSRFADEGIVYNFTQSANACLRQPEGLVWVLFDRGLIEQTLADGRDIIERIHIAPDAEKRLQETMAKSQEDGVLMVSNTLPELSDMLGCPQKPLISALAEYNSFCERGRDALFAKNRRYLRSLNRPPYYAIKAGVDMLVTHGGIRVNKNFEALKENFEPVPNLYVAGVDFGGADADVYNVVMSGHGFGFAVNSGRMAGKNAAGSLR